MLFAAGLQGFVELLEHFPLLCREVNRRLDGDLGNDILIGGFTLYDDTICSVQAIGAYAAFNARGSCGQCVPCKVGATELARRLIALSEGRGGAGSLDEIAGWVAKITDWNRCASTSSLTPNSSVPTPTKRPSSICSRSSLAPLLSMAWNIRRASLRLVRCT